VNALLERVRKDQAEVDYTGQSLDLRNNPWFFSKHYSTQPLLDDTDFLFLIERLGTNSSLPPKKKPSVKEVLPKRLPPKYSLSDSTCVYVPPSESSIYSQ